MIILSESIKMISNIFNITPVGKHMLKRQKNDIKKRCVYHTIYFEQIFSHCETNVYPNQQNFVQR